MEVSKVMLTIMRGYLIIQIRRQHGFYDASSSVEFLSLGVIGSTFSLNLSLIHSSN